MECSYGDIQFRTVGYRQFIRQHPISRGNKLSPWTRAAATPFPVPPTCRLTPRWSGRVKDKVPISSAGVRAAQINRSARKGDDYQ